MGTTTPCGRHDAGAQGNIHQLRPGHDPAITKIRGSEAQANVIWAAGLVQAIAVKNYRQLGIDRPLMLPNGATDPNSHRLAGDSVNGVIFAASSSASGTVARDPPSEGVIQFFVTDFRANLTRSDRICRQWDNSSGFLATAIRKAGTEPQRSATRSRDARPAGHNSDLLLFPDGPLWNQPSTFSAMQTVRNGKFEIAK